MAPTYAGILGCLAFCTVVAHGLVDGRELDVTIRLASFCLFGFAAAGYVIGRIASQTVTDSVTSKMNAELVEHGTEPGHETARQDMTSQA